MPQAASFAHPVTEVSSGSSATTTSMSPPHPSRTTPSMTQTLTSTPRTIVTSKCPPLIMNLPWTLIQPPPSCIQPRSAYPPLTRPQIQRPRSHLPAYPSTSSTVISAPTTTADPLPPPRLTPRPTLTPPIPTPDPPALPLSLLPARPPPQRPLPLNPPQVRHRIFRRRHSQPNSISAIVPSKKSQKCPILTCSFLPSQLIQPCPPSRTYDFNGWTHGDTTALEIDWEFKAAKVPDGISLRNFGIQVVSLII